MPPLPIINDVYRCALNWTCNGQSAVNVLHFRASTPPATPADVYACINAHVTAGIWGAQATVAGVESIDITPLDGVSATQHFVTGLPAKWVGSSGGDFTIAPAIMVKIQTALRGRSHRGRMFLPFVAEGAQQNGFITAATANAIATGIGNWFGACAADATTPLEPGVASYVLGTFTILANLSVETALGTQRRRQGRLR